MGQRWKGATAGLESIATDARLRSWPESRCDVNARAKRQLREVQELSSKVRFERLDGVLMAFVPSTSTPGVTYSFPVDEHKWLSTGFCQCPAASRGMDCRHKQAVDLRLEKRRQERFHEAKAYRHDVAMQVWHGDLLQLMHTYWPVHRMWVSGEVVAKGMTGYVTHLRVYGVTGNGVVDREKKRYRPSDGYWAIVEVEH